MSFKLFNLDEQYAKHPEVKRDEVLKLLDWSLAQPHLPKITEHEALLFYFACNCSMEYAKSVLDLNFTCRTHFEEFFGNVDIATPEMQLVRQTVAGFPLQQQTPEGYIVVMVNIMDPDVSKFNFVNSIKLYSIGQDKWMLESGVMSGLIFVLDLSHLSFGHITRIAISSLKKVMYYLQEAIPGRLVGLHFINASKSVDKLMVLLNPLLKKELMDMFHVHTTMDTFYKFVPRDILPKEYGGPSGELKQLNDAYFKGLMDSRQEIIDYNNTHRVNEKLRPVKAKLNSELFGTEGNFKKLDID